MDDLDRAQELEMMQRQEAIAKQQKRFAALSSIPGAETALDCLQCGVEIPEKRRRAIPGIMVCVDCQTLNEKEDKRYAAR
ncbi:MAG TPA: hypothetical protein DCG63_03800 [Methylophilaceae bacterium]|nr:hypothetical protein [Methylophilaceae bacterium]